MVQSRHASKNQSKVICQNCSQKKNRTGRGNVGKRSIRFSVENGSSGSKTVDCPECGQKINFRYERVGERVKIIYPRQAA